MHWGGFSLWISHTRTHNYNCRRTVRPRILVQSTNRRWCGTGIGTSCRHISSQVFHSHSSGCLPPLLVPKGDDSALAFLNSESRKPTEKHLTKTGRNRAGLPCRLELVASVTTITTPSQLAHTVH